MLPVILILMLLVVMATILKAGFVSRYGLLASAVACGAFVCFTQGIAINSSKTQITDFISSPTHMRDAVVLLSIDVIIQLAFCLSQVRKSTGIIKGRWGIYLYQLLQNIPVLLIFPVLLATLTSAVFAFTGVSFALTTWIIAALVTITLPLLTLMVVKLLPEQELRLELLFLTEVFIAIVGIIATFNNTTVVQGTNNVSWGALGFMLIILLLGSLVGYIIKKIKIKKNITL